MRTPDVITDVLVTLGVVVVLILLNAVFVAAEFAVVGTPRAAIEQRARAGSGTARYIRRLLDRPGERDRFIATAQLGITLASLGLGMYGEHQLAGWIVQFFESRGIGEWVAAHALASAIAV